MQIDYEKGTTDVIFRLEQAGYHEETISDHRRCYDGLQSHFATAGLPFTMEAALEWLERRKKGWTYNTYKRYRGALYRLERYLLTNSIACGYCRGLDAFACQSRLDDQYEALLREFRVDLSAKHRGCKPQEITPELIKEFHNTDEHSTPEGKNAYGVKVRQLLSYMAELKLVPQGLFLAVSTQCAPCRNIVSVMSEKMESAVYQYRSGATAPLELRNAAIVMLGLRMGVRASDIVNLKINDFDWQKMTVSFIQKKTGKAIVLAIRNTFV